MSKTVQDVMNLIQEKGIQMVDFKMVDIHGQFRHVTIPAADFLSSVDLSETGLYNEKNTFKEADCYGQDCTGNHGPDPGKGHQNGGL